MRKASTKLFLSLAAIWALALPAAASAEYLVPPGNSAATQYTETVPTAGGQRDTEKDRRKGGGSPAEVLGADNAQRLDEQGEAGREVAQFAAETAPATSADDEDAPAAGDRSEDDDGREDNRDAGAVGGSSDGTGGGPAAETSGSSGFGEVLAQATGWSSSEGLLLLAILGAIAWALAFLWRQRDRSTA
ncbi:MAG TPA: hypothetical protein VF729_06495 [Solirubrobacterales bacterium]